MDELLRRLVIGVGAMGVFLVAVLYLCPLVAGASSHHGNRHIHHEPTTTSTTSDAAGMQPVLSSSWSDRRRQSRHRCLSVFGLPSMSEQRMSFGPEQYCRCSTSGVFRIVGLSALPRVRRPRW